MGYEAEKDETLWSYEYEEWPGEDTAVLARIRRYNGGDAKIEIARVTQEKGFRKLGRLTPKEADLLVPQLKTASEFIMLNLK